MVLVGAQQRLAGRRLRIQHQLVEGEPGPIELVLGHRGGHIGGGREHGLQVPVGPLPAHHLGQPLLGQAPPPGLGDQLGGRCALDRRPVVEVGGRHPSAGLGGAAGPEVAAEGVDSQDRGRRRGRDVDMVAAGVLPQALPGHGRLPGRAVDGPGVQPRAQVLSRLEPVGPAEGDAAIPHPCLVHRLAPGRLSCPSAGADERGPPADGHGHQGQIAVGQLLAQDLDDDLGAREYAERSVRRRLHEFQPLAPQGSRGESLTGGDAATASGSCPQSPKCWVQLPSRPPLIDPSPPVTLARRGG